jgi:hypothetical protein
MLRSIMRARLPTGAPGWAELTTDLQDLISTMLQVTCLVLPTVNVCARTVSLSLLPCSAGEPKGAGDDVGGGGAPMGAVWRVGCKLTPACRPLRRAGANNTPLAAASPPAVRLVT